MAIQDSSPERRNLTITALGFILFFLGDGALDDNTIKLHIVNVTLNKPEVLTFFLWGLLFWFLWRYWLKFKGSYIYDANQEIQNQSSNFLTHVYVRFKTGLRYKQKNGFNRVMFSGLSSSCLHVSKIKDAEYLDAGKLKEIKTTEGIELPLSFPLRLVLKSYTLVLMFFREPSISNIYVPYLLFLYAVYLGVLRICI